MELPDISISLISYNQLHDLERLAPSLKRALELVQSEVLLVDNRSTDGTSNWAAANHHWVNTIFNGERAGYGANHNINLERAAGRYFVIMNSDMTVKEDIFLRLFEYMESNADVGICSTKVLNEDGSIQGLNKRRPTALDLLLRRFSFPFGKTWISQRMQYYEMRDVGYEHEYDVPFLSGAFMFCRTSALRTFGGFDESFFLYFEDVDLCRQMQQNMRTTYFPGSAVTHLWQRSAHKNWVYTKYFVKSAWRYFRKWGFELY